MPFLKNTMTKKSALTTMVLNSNSIDEAMHYVKSEVTNLQPKCAIRI